MYKVLLVEPTGKILGENNKEIKEVNKENIEENGMSLSKTKIKNRILKGYQIISLEPIALVSDEKIDKYFYLEEGVEKEVLTDEEHLLDTFKNYGMNKKTLSSSKEWVFEKIFNEQGRLASVLPFTMSIQADRDVITTGVADELIVYSDKENEVPVVEIKGYSSPTLVLPTGDMRLEKVSKINSLKLLANDKEELIRIVYSLDSGKTWLTKTEEGEKEVNIEDVEEIQKKGMTIKFFNTINEGWSNEIVKAGKIRFGYYLEKGDTISEVDKLVINLDMYGYWSSERHSDNHAMRISNREITVLLKENGTYKVNF